MKEQKEIKEVEKLKRIRKVVKMAEEWSKDQNNNLTESSICISALKDIRRILNQ